MIIDDPSSDSYMHKPDEELFARIASDLKGQGYSICSNALPADLGNAICEQLYGLDEGDFHQAGIGRLSQHGKDPRVRTDQICWFTGETETGRLWLNWAEQLQVYLNRSLFLGLFSFESHLAYYKPGDFYKRHYDAFQDKRNRVLSLVVYLNRDWQPDDGGELILYRDSDDKTGIRILPEMGKVVLFLSEEFPHQVLPTKRDRFSIAGWFRVNSSTPDRVDPPQ